MVNDTYIYIVRRIVVDEDLILRIFKTELLCK